MKLTGQRSTPTTNILGFSTTRNNASNYNLISLYYFRLFMTPSTFQSSDCVPCSSSAHCAPGTKATVPMDKVFVTPGREFSTRHRLTSTELDAPSLGHSH